LKGEGKKGKIIRKKERKNKETKHRKGFYTARNARQEKDNLRKKEKRRKTRERKKNQRKTLTKLEFWESELKLSKLHL
jgi:hypothetical protein